MAKKPDLRPVTIQKFELDDGTAGRLIWGDGGRTLYVELPPRYDEIGQLADIYAIDTTALIQAALRWRTRPHKRVRKPHTEKSK